ncbi:DUF4272 domain-containing protein [Labrys sp. KB_33_2]|uniref:DUF4272 domain-containing protein n=1 Tax=Labrys sp. KB_33_2 TaxID=3237479 RepID=UPI003F91F021
MGILSRIFGRGAAKPAMEVEAEADDGPWLVNAYATLRELPPLDFPHQLINRRDLSDPEMAGHLEGFAGYVLGRGDGRMTALRYHLWRHIQRVRNQASFTVADDDLPAMGNWVRRANAVLFLPDGSVCTPEMDVLMAADGDADVDAALPYPPDALERRARTLAALDGFTPKPPGGMPPALGVGEYAQRPASEVLQRALALVCVAVQGESVGAGQGSLLAQLRERNPAGIAALTPKETAFIKAAEPDREAAMAMSWRYEALNVLAWALSLEGAELGPADRPADAAALSQTMLEAAHDDALPGRASLRPAEAILEALDLTWRQHWIVRQAQQSGTAVAGLNADIVMERHFALNWLTGFHNPPGTAWDDTDTPT